MLHIENKRFDVARGLAALVVFVAHVSQVFIWRFLQPQSWLELVSGTAARAAVLVFFLLSGLLITRSIATNIKRNGFFEPFDYLLNRIARLYPPFIAALALAVLVVWIVIRFNLPGAHSPLGTLRPDGLTYSYPELVKSLFLIDGMTVADGPLWTLYIEAKMYVIAMGAAMIFRGSSISSRIMGLTLAGAAVWLGLDLYKFWFFAMTWVLGALANIPALNRPAVFLTVAIVAILLGYSYPSTYIDYLDNKVGLAVQAAFCAVAAYTLLLKSWAEFKFPNWLQDTGKYSYTLYVAHFPLLALGLSTSLMIDEQSMASAILFATISAAATLAIVFFSAKWLEDVPRYKRLLESVFLRFKAVNA